MIFITMFVSYNDGKSSRATWFLKIKVFSHFCDFHSKVQILDYAFDFFSDSYISVKIF
jgi:hypothetical protein